MTVPAMTRDDGPGGPGGPLGDDEPDDACAAMNRPGGETLGATDDAEPRMTAPVTATRRSVMTAPTVITPGNGAHRASRPGPGPGPGPDPLDRPAVADLIIPLLTLLGLAARPGEGHGLGPLDPALCRRLAATAANWPASQWCLTITDPDGIAIAHGCAKPARPSRPRTRPAASRAGRRRPPATRRPGTAAPPPGPVPGRAPGPGQPHPPADGPGRPAPPGAPRLPRRSAASAQPGPTRPRPGRADGSGTWTLTLPDGRDPHRPTRAGPGLRLRPPARITRLPAQRHAPPPGPDQGSRMHLPHLLPARPRQRLRARRPLPPGRPHLRVQRRGPQPPLPPRQAVTRLDPHPAPPRLAPVDHPGRLDLHPGTLQVPLVADRRVSGRGGLRLAAAMPGHVDPARDPPSP